MYCQLQPPTHMHAYKVVMHLFPALVSYVNRWMPTYFDHYNCEHVDHAIDARLGVMKFLMLNDECVMGVYTWLVLPLGIYVLWQALYLIKTEWIEMNSVR